MHNIRVRPFLLHFRITLSNYFPYSTNIYTWVFVPTKRYLQKIPNRTQAKIFSWSHPWVGEGIRRDGSPTVFFLYNIIAEGTTLRFILEIVNIYTNHPPPTTNENSNLRRWVYPIWVCSRHGSMVPYSPAEFLLNFWICC